MGNRAVPERALSYLTGSAGLLPGLQLSTLGEAPKRDLSDTLRQVATIGYRAVELPGHYERTAAQLRDSLSEVGMACPSIHVALRPLPGLWDLQGDLSRLADDVGTIGAEYVVVGGPWLPDRVWQIVHSAMMGHPQPDIFEAFASLCSDDWRRTADLLNEKAAILARSGLHVAYHNHDVEFLRPVGEAAGWSILVERTDPEVVSFELDTGWAASAGADPVELLESLGQRVRLIQAKDVARASTDVLRLAATDVGTGIVHWQRLSALARRIAVRHVFFEQDPPFAKSPMHSAGVAFQLLSHTWAAAS